MFGSWLYWVNLVLALLAGAGFGAVTGLVVVFRRIGIGAAAGWHKKERAEEDPGSLGSQRQPYEAPELRRTPAHGYDTTDVYNNGVRAGLAASHRGGHEVSVPEATDPYSPPAPPGTRQPVWEQSPSSRPYANHTAPAAAGVW